VTFQYWNYSINNMKTQFGKETAHQQGNYIYMLVGLLALIIIGPALSENYVTSSRIITQLAFSGAMFVGIWSLQIDRFWFRLGLGFIFTSIMLSIINYFIDSKLIFFTGLATSLIFLFFSIYIAIKNILFSGKITANKIVGSLCIYLLIGVIWGLIYILISVIFPEAFPLLEHSNRWDYLYFSFVTLTTLGYGDITPSLPLVRSLAYLEAICGQFYLAILVSSLVGAYLTDHNQNMDSE